MTLFICTAGTSIAGGPVKSGETNDHYRARIEAKIRKDRTENATRDAFLVRVSVELNGLFRAGVTDTDEVAFLTSETEDGRLCGERLVGLVEKEFGCRAIRIEVKGLQVRDGARFRNEGITHLFATLDNLTAERNREETKLNATGGFKGTVPYMVLYGMFNGLTVSYVYEFSDTLITLPPLPVEFDWARVAPAAQTILAVAQAGALEEDEWRGWLPRDYYARQPIYDTLFEFDRGTVGLSAVGCLMKKRLEEAAGATVVHLSPSASNALDRSDSAAHREFQIMLARVRDPTARRQSHHQDSLHTCDLKVWKRYAGQGPRMCYWVEGDDVYVAELFPTHPEYDRFWQQFPKNRIDYEKSSFTTCESEIALDYSMILSDMKQVGLQDDQYRREIDEEIVSLRRQADNLSMRTNSRITEAKKEVRAEADTRYRKMQSSYSKQIAEKAKEIEELRSTLAVLLAERDHFQGA